MASKDKFKKMQQSGGGALSSFQEMATTVAAIENGATVKVKPVEVDGKAVQEQPDTEQTFGEVVRYMRLPNPQIPVREYNLISAYVNSLTNMTRQDWVELAFIEKLHNDKQITDEEFNARQFEICHRPPRGQRRGVKAIKDGARQNL